MHYKKAFPTLDRRVPGTVWLHQVHGHRKECVIRQSFPVSLRWQNDTRRPLVPQVPLGPVASKRQRVRSFEPASETSGIGRDDVSS